MVDLVSTHVEEIYKAFKPHLPPNCVEIIIRLHDENRQLQTSVNDMANIVNTMKQAMQLTVEHAKILQGQMKRFEARHSDPTRDLINERTDDG